MLQIFLLDIGLEADSSLSVLTLQGLKWSLAHHLVIFDKIIKIIRAFSFSHQNKPN